MKTRSTRRLAAAALAILVQPVPSVVAQGSLTPPGAPAPTMKTLDQLEPRTPIDAANTPGDATSLFRISAPGSYYLTGEVAGAAGKNGIAVEADDVTIDLGGFTLRGGTGTLDGVYVTGGHARLVLRNGTITGWADDGVDEVDTAATAGTYQDLRLVTNGAAGLRLGTHAVVTGCNFLSNGGRGVFVDGSATVRRCRAHDNGDSGICISAGTVLDSVSSANTSHGFECVDEPVLIQDCVAFENSGSGFRIFGGGRITGCIARLNDNSGIDAGSFSTVTRCTVKNNPWGIFAGSSCRIVDNMCEGNGDGIYTFGSRNEIDGNQAINGGTGIKVDDPFPASTNNLVIRNTAGNNTTNFNIAANNRYGPILDITAGGTPGVTGDTGADTTTTTHPWANFSY